MMIRYLWASVLLTLCLFAPEAASGGQVSFRIVSYMDKHDQPAGLTEGAPGLFYGIAGSYTHVGFSVTTQGLLTILGKFSKRSQHPVPFRRWVQWQRPLYWSVENGLASKHVLRHVCAG